MQWTGEWPIPSWRREVDDWYRKLWDEGEHKKPLATAAEIIKARADGTLDRLLEQRRKARDGQS